MDVALFVQGFGLGLVIAAAIGPIALLCIRRTLVEGALVGFVSGLGAATADALYAAVAAFGLTTLRDALINIRVPLALAGGAFLVWLGIRTMRSTPALAADAPEPRGSSLPTCRRSG